MATYLAFLYSDDLARKNPFDSFEMTIRVVMTNVTSRQRNTKRVKTEMPDKGSQAARHGGECSCRSGSCEEERKLPGNIASENQDVPLRIVDGESEIADDPVQCRFMPLAPGHQEDCGVGGACRLLAEPRHERASIGEPRTGDCEPIPDAGNRRRSPREVGRDP